MKVVGVKGGRKTVKFVSAPFLSSNNISFLFGTGQVISAKEKDKLRPN